MYDYFANKSKHGLIVKNIYKNMAIYLKNRKLKVQYILGIDYYCAKNLAFLKIPYF